MLLGNLAGQPIIFRRIAFLILGGLLRKDNFSLDNRPSAGTSEHAMNGFPEDIFTEPPNIAIPSAATASTPANTAKATISADGPWSYDEDTVMMIRGRDEPFHHAARNTLARVAEPTPNPLARRD